MPWKYTLTPEELSEISDTAANLAQSYCSVEDQNLLADLTVFAQGLPFGVRKFLNDFRLADEDSDYAVVSGFPIDNAKIGPTPPHWDNRPATSPTLHEEIYMMMLCSLVGDPFAWATQQGGYICHDLLPVKGLENEQVGASSECVLRWHTEDAFHPYRGDYLGLMCFRNPDNTATTIGSLDISLLTEEEIEVLFEPRFQIKPDDSHLPEAQGRTDFWQGREKERLAKSLDEMSKAVHESPKVPLLYGDKSAPFICADPVYMDQPANDNTGSAAFQSLIEALDKNLEDIVLKPGDVVIADNARVIHGRQPFKARYDGNDRWLKRVNVSADLRKSFPVRGGESRRQIF